MKQVYVVMGMCQSTNPNGIWIVVVTLGTTQQNYSTTDVSLLQKPVFIQGISLTATNSLPTTLNFLGASPAPSTASIDIPNANVGSPVAPFTPLIQNVGGQSITFNRLILFTPLGEALVNNSSTINHWVNLGLTLSTGPSTNAALLQICGLTSQCIAYRQ